MSVSGQAQVLNNSGAAGGANSRQEGGIHYKQFTYQPWDVIIDWDLGYLDGNVLKYVSRWRHKSGLNDLKKARHYLDKLIELETMKLERLEKSE